MDRRTRRYKKQALEQATRRMGGGHARYSKCSIYIVCACYLFLWTLYIYIYIQCWHSTTFWRPRSLLYTLDIQTILHSLCIEILIVNWSRRLHQPTWHFPKDPLIMNVRRPPLSAPYTFKWGWLFISTADIWAIKCDRLQRVHFNAPSAANLKGLVVDLPQTPTVATSRITWRLRIWCTRRQGAFFQIDGPTKLISNIAATGIKLRIDVVRVPEWPMKNSSRLVTKHDPVCEHTPIHPL